MMRYIKSLENKDLSLNTSMISLGSCTMKLNAATQLIPLSWPEFNAIHPFAPADQWTGYRRIIAELEAWLEPGNRLLRPRRCNQTAAPRANMPDCSRSAPTMPTGANRTAMSFSFPFQLMAPTRISRDGRFQSCCNQVRRHGQHRRSRFYRPMLKIQRQPGRADGHLPQHAWRI